MKVITAALITAGLFYAGSIAADAFTTYYGSDGSYQGRAITIDDRPSPAPVYAPPRPAYVAPAPMEPLPSPYDYNPTYAPYHSDEDE